MSLSERIHISYRFTLLCWQFFERNKDLLYYPIISLLATIVAALLGGLPTYWLAAGFSTPFGFSEQTSMILAALLGLVTMALLGLISIGFNAALIVSIQARLRGESTSMHTCLRQALRYWPQLLAWSIISALIGILLNAVENSRSPLANIIGMVSDVAWSLCAYFVLPFVVLEGLGPIAAIKASAATFRNKYKKIISVNIIFALVGAAIVIVCLSIGYVIVRASPELFYWLIAAGVLLGALMMLVASTFATILKIALFQQIVKQQALAEFNSEELTQALLLK